MVELEPDGIDVAARRARARRRRQAEARAHHPQLPEPGRLHAVGATSASGCSSSRARTSFTIFEDDPYVALRFEGDAAADDALDGRRHASSTRRRSRRPSVPGSASATWSGRAELIARIVKLATSTYISPNMVSQAIVYELLHARARSTRSIETVKEALRERAETLCEALRDKLPDARFVEPEGGYFLWVDLPRGDRRRRAVRRRRRARRAVRQGHRLRARGRRARACAWPTPASRPSRSKRASTGSPRPTARRRPASPPEPVPARRRLAAVALAAEHELLGQRDPRRRRRVGEHRHGLGDAAR